MGRIKQMIILGVILLLIGVLFNVPVAWSLGIVALVVGLVLALAGGVGRTIGGRRHYF